MKKRYLFSLLAVSVAAACQAQADTWPEPGGPSQSDFGGVGLMQVPTARMAKEGEFSLNARDNDQYRYYSASLQLFPWLETTVRYTDVRTRQYSAVSEFSGTQSYKDKAFDLKLRLWQEGFWLPEVAVGTPGLGGTGLFDSGYRPHALVATRYSLSNRPVPPRSRVPTATSGSQKPSCHRRSFRSKALSL